MSTQGFGRPIRAAVLATGVMAGSVAGAGAQTTLVLNVPGSQVTDTMIQGGINAKTNFNKSDALATSANSNYAELRHALLKFDTQNTMPGGSHIASATLTLTLKSAGADANRSVSVFPITSPFVQEEANWNQRRGGYAWTTAGGDFGPLATTQTVSNVAGTRVSINVTAIVQAAVSSASSSRYTRLGLVDAGVSSAGSLRQYYSSKAVDPSVRPVLSVVYGGDEPNSPQLVTPPPSLPPPTTTATTATLRVLQYNTHHGGWGTDGVYNPSRLVAWVVKANPDIVSLNEIEVNTSWSKGADQTTLYQTLIQNATGRAWYKVFMTNAGNTNGNGNLILSKYPFIATATNLLPADRSAVDATISVNGRTINFTSTHLDSVSATNRLAELADLLPWETTLAEQRLILGDYNAWPETTEIATMKATYIDTWASAQSLGTAAGNGITHGAHRIDYIFQSKSATYLSLTSTQVFNTSDANGVKPSDHEPVLAVFQVK
jgi:endonuclease/exonuclease/phosphatase family metal-dependent hydrolase